MTIPPPIPGRPRIIFINRFYWPDESATAQLLTDLAESLAARGLAVTVIASRPKERAVPERELRRQVRIERVGRAQGKERSLAAKALSFAVFAAPALVRLARLARKGDAVVALTDPPLIGVAAWMVARAKGARCFHWVQDIYPEIALALAGRDGLGRVRAIRNRIWRRSEACVTLGEDMASVIAGAGVAAEKIHVVPNWAPAGLAEPEADAVADLRRRWGLEGKFVVAYSGNLGRVHNIAPVLEVAAALAEDPAIAFLFVGDGPQRRIWEAEARRRGLDRVEFRPAQPREALAASLGAGDVHLVTLRPGCERYVFPSKLYGAAAVGRPVVFIGPTGAEPARLIAAAGFGRAFEQGEIAAIARTVRELSRSPADRAEMGARARRFAAASGANAAATAWDRILTPRPSA